MFKINGTEVNVGIVSMKRGVKKTYKYDVTTEDGARHSEIKAIYPAYTLLLGSITQSDYDALYSLINDYSDVLSVTLPDGQTDITFDASIDISGDNLVFVEGNGKRRWDNLSIVLTGVAPLARV